jgi:tetratricopeptide (TPR) repeat protein
MPRISLPELPSKPILWAICGVFLALGLIVYGQSLGNDFVRFDDGLLIYENPAIRTISPSSLKTIFTSYDPELYIPLTFLSYQIDYQIAGTHAWMYHLHSLLLHVGNAILLCWLLYLLTRSGIAAVIAGGIFAVHPLHTEAVAWAAALKDVQSTFFFLASLIAYLYFTESEERKPYLWSLLFFLLGLLSKVMVITLPVVLLLIDFVEGRPVTRKTLMEKIPYFGLSVIFGIVALLGKSEIVSGLSPLQTGLMAIRSTALYAWKLIVPYGFTVLYPYTDAVSIGSPDFFVPLLSVAIAVTVAIVSLKWRRDIAVGIGFFLLTLIPTFFNYAKGGDIYSGSDRYAYLPSIGLFFLLAVGLRALLSSETVREGRQRLQFIGSIAGVLIIILGFLSYKQSLTWKSTEDLFQNVLKFFPKSYAAHTNLANVYRRRDMLDEAEKELKEALKDGDHAIVHNNLGALFAKQGRLSEALSEFEKAKGLNPKSAEPYMGIGLAYAQNGEPEKALEAYTKALNYTGNAAQIYTNRGALQMDVGRVDEAISDYKKAIEAEPSFSQAHYNLAIAYTQKGDLESAVASYEKVTQLQPQFYEAFFNVGLLYAKLGQLNEAEEAFKEVLRIQPNLQGAQDAIDQIQRAKAQHGIR